SSTNEAVKTDVAGYFVMQIQISDELVLEENDLYQLQYQIRASDLQKTLIRIYPQPLTTVLEEVKVSQITTKSLGIDAKTIIENTPSTNMNMDFFAMFSWLFKKLRTPKLPVEKGR